MEHSRRNILFSSAFLLFLLLPVTIPAQLLPIVDDTSSNHHIYIIHVDRHKTHDLLGDEELESFHRSFLPNTKLDSGLPRLVYSYRHVISGFAARLTPSELDVIRSMPGVLSADLDQVYQLETTYTPKYLGLTKQNGWGGTMMGNGMVIGIIDSGIKPGHPSFSDYHMPPAPPTWNGNCTTPGSGFVCNNKIISGKAFSGGTHPSPVDTNGHGTHVASIAAGRQVNGASVLGTAKGVAIGMAPKAHLAIYKVCFANGCDGMDIIAAIDQAIKDGVDVINMSISGSPTAPLYDDSVALGSMAAIQHGIVAVSSAGNRGPKTMSLSHCAPWVIAVGAVSTDRRATSKVELGDGRTFNGQTAYQPVNTFDSSKFYPLEFPGKNGNVAASCCVPHALSNMNFRGQIVLCNPGIVKDEEKGEAVYARGAEGMIILNLPQQGYTTFSKAHVIAASNVNYPDGVDILDYFYKNTNNATATFRFFDTEFGFTPSPSIGYFSSRGPSQMNGGLIKPDVVAPGVNILAAWIKDVGPNPDPMATHTFNFDSGTSMAAPHVSGIASLVKSQHRDWTPAEILSAIVTTAKDSMSGAAIEVEGVCSERVGVGADGNRPGRKDIYPWGNDIRFDQSAIHFARSAGGEGGHTW
ncbi:hypothetical protein HPP92_019524 [Vanilla planifolia]|uniref:Uncharacterized protein n=1 Tax=Vanilla planifolia TaxID=51239 RepID=A0A835Q6Y6_VANPL|nr:hypothetical protein HPP92_019524 [Vanilla planifolia]